MRIYADSLKPNIPYKTILLSTTDTADFAVAEALEKYGLEKESPRDYCIARVRHTHTHTHIGTNAMLLNDQCFLEIQEEHLAIPLAVCLSHVCCPYIHIQLSL